MSRVRIFVEGIADVRFLTDCITHYVPAASLRAFEFIDMGGKDGLLQNPEDESFPFVENTDAGGINLVVFDADGSHQARAKELRDAAAKAAISFEHFLFPDDQHRGDLEVLLCELVPDDKRVILDCHDGFVICMESHEHLSLQLPLLKSKVFAYLDALLPKRQKSKAKEAERDYRNTTHWNLDAPALEPLRKFLIRHLTI